MFCRSSLLKALNGYMPDMDLLHVSETYDNFSPLTATLVTTMEMSADVPLVESAFGPVQAGSVLSYQLPQPKTCEIVMIADAPSPPKLPLDGYRLLSSQCAYVLSHQEQFHLKALETTYEMSHKVEVATREQSSSPEWHQLRKMRITSSRFRKVCHVRGETSADHLAERMFKGSGMQTMEMKRGLAMEPTLKNVNFFPCGFVVHPDALWLGSSPDGIIFDPSVRPHFGLLEVKCPNVPSYVDCPYLKIQNGELKLKRSHAYYWQVQGQFLLTGCSWCDFVICAQEDVLVERISKDLQVSKTIREKVDHFYFYHYMQKYLSRT
uniref:YqaJ viral recombinase domain-containing protein n=1 Tax=Oncorhynchus tshawytscha TaxID=74940 RepID=A0AAZ3NQ29_ONCTS